MNRMLLKSKIHRATVTDADLHYEGSVTLDPVLMEAANVLHHERVEIYNVDNGERFATYAIPGTPNAGEVVLNGAAAHKVKPGHLVIICTYADYSEEETQRHHPDLIYVDGKNRIVEHKTAVRPVAAAS